MPTDLLNCLASTDDNFLTNNIWFLPKLPELPKQMDCIVKNPMKETCSLLDVRHPIQLPSLP